MHVLRNFIEMTFYKTYILLLFFHSLLLLNNICLFPNINQIILGEQEYLSLAPQQQKGTNISKFFQCNAILYALFAFLH